MKKTIEKIIKNLVLWALGSRVEEYSIQKHISLYEQVGINNWDCFIRNTMGKMANDISQKLLEDKMFEIEVREEKSDQSKFIRIKLKVIK